MLSSLCLAYVHLRLQEVFGSSQWFGAMNVLFVGDILQLPPVNGSMVFQNIFCNKVIAARLDCMTSVNIWRETVKYDELTINERQKQDPEFGHLLNEVMVSCISDKTITVIFNTGIFAILMRKMVTACTFIALIARTSCRNSPAYFLPMLCALLSNAPAQTSL